MRRRLAFWLFLASSGFIASCAPTPPAVPVATIRAIDARPAEPALPAEPRAPAEVPCATSEVTIDDAGQTLRWTRGRELVPGKRGAPHAFAELVMHEDGLTVFSLEALAPEGKKGSVALKAHPFDPARLSGHDVEGRLEYSGGPRLGVDGPVDIHFERFGAVGEMVEGSFEVPAFNVKMRFRVCRTNDWHSQH